MFFYEWNAMIFSLFTSYICLFTLWVVVTFWPCYAERGRKIALGRSSTLHAYICIELYLMMMMMIWFNTSLSVKKLLGFFKKSLYSQDSPNALKWKFKFGIIKAKKGKIVRDRGSNIKTKLRSLKKFCLFTYPTLWVTFVLIVASKSLSFHMHIMHHHVEVKRLFLKLSRTL